MIPITSMLSWDSRSPLNELLALVDLYRNWARLAELTGDTAGLRAAARMDCALPSTNGVFWSYELFNKLAQLFLLVVLTLGLQCAGVAALISWVRTVASDELRSFGCHILPRWSCEPQ